MPAKQITGSLLVKLLDVVKPEQMRGRYRSSQSVVCVLFARAEEELEDSLKVFDGCWQLMPALIRSVSCDLLLCANKDCELKLVGLEPIHPRLF